MPLVYKQNRSDSSISSIQKIACPGLTVLYSSHSWDLVFHADKWNTVRNAEKEDGRMLGS